MLTDRVQISSGFHELSVRVVGKGPLVVLIHGWPELGLSWRHQIEPLANAGFTVAVPDMRGYGRSAKPVDVRAYRLDTLADDILAIADALGHKNLISVGHDWGAPVAWRTALRYPERVAGVFALSVPYSPPRPIPALETYKALFKDRFFYMLYFQEIGLAEAELERDVRASLKKIFFSLSGDAPQDDWLAHRPKDAAILPGLSAPPRGPLSFMSDQELDKYAQAFEKGGFFGPLSWYRNFDSDFADIKKYGDAIVRQPAAFLCGEKEIILSMMPDSLEAMREHVPNLLFESILPGAGHWIQQERPLEVTKAILKFLTAL